MNPSDILASSHTIAIIGLSPNPQRDSFEVAQYLQQHGYRIIPVNPGQAGRAILGEPCYASLTEAANALAQQGVTIDIVDCFRKAEDIPPIAAEAIAIHAKCLWMQLGIVNEAAAAQAQAAGLHVVMDHCTKIVHRNRPAAPSTKESV
jgi:predicted CoA-binding protein